MSAADASSHDAGPCRGARRLAHLPVSGRHAAGQAPLHAVNGVDLSIRSRRGRGPRRRVGCGKTTLARMLLGLLRAVVRRDPHRRQAARALERRAIAALVQPVFQDPYSSLNPRKSVGSIIAPAAARAGRSATAETWRARVGDMMERVGLRATALRQLSEPALGRPAPARRHRPRAHQSARAWSSATSRPPRSTSRCSRRSSTCCRICAATSASPIC